MCVLRTGSSPIRNLCDWSLSFPLRAIDSFSFSRPPHCSSGLPKTDCLPPNVHKYSVIELFEYFSINLYSFSGLQLILMAENSPLVVISIYIGMKMNRCHSLE